MDNYDDYALEWCLDCERYYKHARCEPDRGLCADCLQAHIDADKSGESDCGACGAVIGPSTDFLWHREHEDCRAIKLPRLSH